MTRASASASQDCSAVTSRQRCAWRYQNARGFSVPEAKYPAGGNLDPAAASPWRDTGISDTGPGALTRTVCKSVAEGATPLSLDVLTEDDANELLRRRLGPHAHII
jgi:hypothetical protein